MLYMNSNPICEEIIFLGNRKTTFLKIAWSTHLSCHILLKVNIYQNIFRQNHFGDNSLDRTVVILIQLDQSLKTKF